MTRLSKGLLKMGLVASLGSATVACYGAPVGMYEDFDGDGYPALDDCDDTNAEVYPGAPEPEDATEDLNCDVDNDGALWDEDCDDNDPDRFPGAEELAGDEIDSNCDGEDDT